MVVHFFVAHRFAQVVIEGQMDAFHVGQIGGDVAVGNLDQPVLHVLGMNEFDVIDQIQFFEQHRADESVEITAGHEPEFLIGHLTSPEQKGWGMRHGQGAHWNP